MKMIQLTITDSFGNQLDIGDVMVVHFTNPRIKYFGVLKFDEQENVFVIHDYEGWHPFNKNLKHATYERLAGHEVLHRELVKQLGRVQVRKEKEFDKIFAYVKNNQCRKCGRHQVYVKTTAGKTYHKATAVRNRG
jgi:hypothetical protein